MKHRAPRGGGVRVEWKGLPGTNPERGCLHRPARGLKALKGGQRICTECGSIHDSLEVLEPKEGPFQEEDPVTSMVPGERGESLREIG